MSWINNFISSKQGLKKPSGSKIEHKNTPLFVSENLFVIKFDFNVSLLMSHKILKTLLTMLSLKLLNFGDNSLWGKDDLIMLLLLRHFVKWKLQNAFQLVLLTILANIVAWIAWLKKIVHVKILLYTFYGFCIKIVWLILRTLF